MTTNGQVPPARNQFNMYEKIDAELSTHVAKIKYILELQDSLFTANNDREMFRIQRDEAKKRIDALEFQRDARSVEHADKVAQLVDDLNAARKEIVNVKAEANRRIEAFKEREEQFVREIRLLREQSRSAAIGFKNAQAERNNLAQRLKHERDCNAELTAANVQLNIDNQRLNQRDSDWNTEVNELNRLLKDARELAYVRLGALNRVIAERDETMHQMQMAGINAERRRIRAIINEHKAWETPVRVCMLDSILDEIGE